MSDINDNNNKLDEQFNLFEPLVQPMAKSNGQRLDLGPNETFPYIPTIIDAVPDAQTQLLSAGGKRVTGQNVRDIYYTMSSPVAFWSRGNQTPWSQEVVDNGGYAKGAVIREYEVMPGGVSQEYAWCYYISIVDDNTDPKPTYSTWTNSGSKWQLLYAFKTIDGGTPSSFFIEQIFLDTEIRLAQISTTGVGATYARESMSIGNYKNPNNSHVIRITNQLLNFSTSPTYTINNVKNLLVMTPSNLQYYDETTGLARSFYGKEELKTYTITSNIVKANSFMDTQLNKNIGQIEYTGGSSRNNFQKVRYNGEKSVTISGSFLITTSTEVPLPFAINKDTAICVVSLETGITTSSFVDVRGNVITDTVLQLDIEAGGVVTGDKIIQYIIEAELR